MTRRTLIPAIAALILSCGGSVGVIPAAAQGVPVMGPQSIVELRAILEIALLQDDPAVQEQLDELREHLAEEALTREEADELYSNILNSKGTPDDQ
ncbi:hypothetical protein [Ruegeria sp. ANG-R]|uniref:hypothetical protein n=1 Tax=Ruegeria sp. ANG-R TaxID=1577903 RepID=UPI001269E6DE|nr:hypothetical protein [Ruegeria sp. ANG-R]